ncbi:MAG TPA: L-threonylcarbamoyladenylate synthase [Candidatus Paceibacterota bacterium]
MNVNWQKAEKILKNDGVVVLPTDTLYGVVASIFSKKAVRKIYKIKGRSNNKPLIVLISSYSDLNKLGIKINRKQLSLLKKNWPGKVSVELIHSDKNFSYIRGGHNYSGFRMVGEKNKNLLNLIKSIGPIIAPSANKQGEKPAETIKEAKEYFGNNVDLYIDGGKKIGEPSTLIRIKNCEVEVLRQGVIKIK